jgi:hypothetical protein
MIRRVWLAIGGVGFVLSAGVHLATFTPAAPALREGYVLALFAGAFAPLVAMLRSLRRRPVTHRWRRVAMVDWRALVATVPPGMRMLVFAAASYALMNLTLSLLVAAEEEAGAGRAGMIRLLSGHLLLLYLIPVVYFGFAHGATANAADQRP